jgi:hypothetical protein
MHVDGASPAGLSTEAAEQMAAASVARAAGDVEAMQAALVAAFAAARATGDSEAQAAAALAMPTSQRFGVHPGQIPALLHEAYEVAQTPLSRCRLAAALARSWVYGGDAVRAARFADEANRLAAEVATPEAAADALDAALLARWGPDDFSERVSLAARLDDVSAHVADPELRLSANLWRLSTAWECLDILAVNRQMRALDLVASESGSARAAFFAASRRAMHALATDDLASADRLIARTATIGADVAEPDAEGVLHELGGMRALVSGDLVALGDEAAAFEAFGTAEGIASVSAVGASLWLAAGQPDRAGVLVTQLTAGGIDGVARDVDFLLTVSLVVGVAVGLEISDIAREGAAALAPYAGRGVLNAGAVNFHGVVDDYLYRAGRLLGEADADRWRHTAGGAYRRVGAGWWERNLRTVRPRAPSTPARSISFTQNNGQWCVGAEGATFALADLKGLQYLRYLLERPGIDVGALALSDAVAGHPGATLDQADLGTPLDPAALSAYRRRLVELDAGLDAADIRGDQPAAAKLSAEREALLHQLQGATGLGGRRRLGGASSERARIAVRKAIATVLSKIEDQDPGVARLLRESVQTGASCRYDPNPDQPIIWITG